MKKRQAWWAATMILAAGGVLAQRPDWVSLEEPAAGPREAAATVVIGQPGLGNFDFYDRFLGVEVALRHWGSAPVGLGAVLGVTRAEVDPNSQDALTVRVGRFSGDAMLYALGCSGYLPLHFRQHENWSLLFEAGLRYVIVQSDVSFRLYESTEREKVDIENGLLLLVGVDVSYRLDDAKSLFGGAAIQHDLVMGSLEVGPRAGRDSELQGFLLRFGGRFRF